MAAAAPPPPNPKPNTTFAIRCVGTPRRRGAPPLQIQRRPLQLPPHLLELLLSPCASWLGVSCTHGRVSRLVLENSSLQIPLSVNRPTHLLTLRLEGNNLSGSISSLTFPNLQEFNISGNSLTAELPPSFSPFPASAFSNNPKLCPPPLRKCNPSSTGGAMVLPVSRRTTVLSETSTKPNPPIKSKSHDSKRSRISSLAIIGIIIGDVLVLGIVSIVLYCYFWRNYSSMLMSEKSSVQAEKIVYSSCPYPNPAKSGYERGKMVFLDGERRFELEDLLMASAEMLGKGGFGTEKRRERWRLSVERALVRWKKLC